MTSIIRNREALREGNRGLPAKAHKQKWEQLAETWQFSKEDSDRTSYHNCEKLYKVNENSFTTETEPIRAQINIYADGSKTDENTGCGFAINRYSTEIAADSIRLPDYTTVYQAEVIAIHLAMIEVRQHLREEDCSIPLIFNSYPPLRNMTVRNILLVQMYFHPYVTINARPNEIYLQYVYYNLLALILFSTSSYVLVSVLYMAQYCFKTKKNQLSQSMKET